MIQRALVLGVTGQDGSILADLLLEKGCEVHGLFRHTSTGNLSRIAHLLGRPGFTLHRGDLTDVGSLYRVFAEVRPDLLFNEADQDNVGWSHALPSLAARVTFAAVADVLEIVRQVVPGCRVFQPCSSTIFGDAPDPQSEDTPLSPMSPYAVSKAAALHLARMYRRVHGLHISCGILFNHTSVRQTEEYLLHKICKGAVRIARGQQETLALGNLETRVDIGCAWEFMQAAVRMVEQERPGDYVLATGESYPIGDLVEIAMRCALVPGGSEHRVTADPRFYTEEPLPAMRGDARRAQAVLGWKATRDASDLATDLVEHYQRMEG